MACRQKHRHKGGRNSSRIQVGQRGFAQNGYFVRFRFRDNGGLWAAFDSIWKLNKINGRFVQNTRTEGRKVSALWIHTPKAITRPRGGERSEAPPEGPRRPPQRARHPKTPRRKRRKGGRVRPQGGAAGGTRRGGPQGRGENPPSPAARAYKTDCTGAHRTRDRHRPASAAPAHTAPTTGTGRRARGPAAGRRRAGRTTDRGTGEPGRVSARPSETGPSRPEETARAAKAGKGRKRVANGRRGEEPGGRPHGGPGEGIPFEVPRTSAGHGAEWPRSGPKAPKAAGQSSAPPAMRGRAPRPAAVA